MNVFIVLITNEYEKKKEICEFEMHLKKLFYLRSILSNDEIVSALRPGLKKGVDFRGQFCRVWKMTFLSEIGSGFG